MNSLFVIYGLIPNKTAEIAKIVADRNDLYFLSISDLIEYEFSKVVFEYESCNNDYFQNRVEKLVKGVFEYENSVIFMDIDTLLNGNILDVAKLNSKLIFINFNCSDLVPTVNNIVFDEMRSECLECADFVVLNSNEDDMIKQIEEYLHKQIL